MRKRSLLLAVLAAVPAFAAYSPFLTDNLTSTTSSWASYGSLNEGSSGLTSSSSGSLIYTGSMGGSEYEVRGTFNIPTSLTSTNNLSYVLYLQAASGALYPSTATSYYALVLSQFVWTTTPQGQLVCSANMATYKSSGGTLTQLNSAAFTCSQITVVRFIYGSSNQILAYVGAPNTIADGYTLYAKDSSPLSGVGGIGAMNTTPSGSSASQVQLYHGDTVAPNPIDLNTVGTSVFSNEVDFQWKGASDDANGSGVALYLIQRNGMTSFWDATSAGFADTASLSPSTGYNYLVITADYYLNEAGVHIPIATPPTGYIDPREVGVRNLGSYWGGAGEQIDMRTGNLNYSLTLFSAPLRNGKSVPFGLSYNSQNWRSDPAGTWQLGRDVGFGYGWKLQAGSLLPVWGSADKIDHYLFVDSTGAEYRLDQKTAATGYNVWASTESIHLTFNDATNTLIFPDGTFWVFGCVSAGAEDDAGTLYPTTIEDSNGNQVVIAYAAGIGLAQLNTSSRLTSVYDATSSNGRTLLYNSDPIPHLTTLNDYESGSGYYTFTYSSSPQVLESPLSTATTTYGSYDMLLSYTQTYSGRTYSFGYSTKADSSSTGELASVTMPDGGSLGWAYTPITYYGGRVQDEVTNRTLTMSAGATPYTYNITHTDTVNTDVVHSGMRVDDAGVNYGGTIGTVQGEKSWAFQTDPSKPNLGLATSYTSRPQPYPASAGSRVEQFAYSYDASNNNPYVSTDAVTIDYNNPSQTVMETTQTLDAWGNVTAKAVYDYGYAVGATPIRSYTNTLQTGSSWTDLGMNNLLLSSAVTDNLGNTATLVQNTYDVGTLAAAGSGTTRHDSSYGTSKQYRGLVTKQVTPAKTVTTGYDTTGIAVTSSDSTTTVSVTLDTTNSVPVAITPNSNTNLQTTLTYENTWFAPNSVTGPNSTSSSPNTASTQHDSAGRVSTTTSVDGSITTYTYNTFSSAASPSTIKAVVSDNGVAVRYTLTTLDGLGRTARVERGTLNGGTKTVVSRVDTQYAPCGCSPLGKVSQVSQPYVADGTQIWTKYAYDGLGRTIQITAPDGSTAKYAYSANTVTVTDPAGHSKMSTTDALGNLTAVSEPDPKLGTVTTSYSYDVLGHLTQVSMPRSGTTQIRTFNYTVGNTVGTQLLSTTNPESGTTLYAYKPDGTLWKKGQKNGGSSGKEIRYTYDTYKRVTIVQRGSFTGTWPNETFSPIAAQETDYFYDTATGCSNGQGRLCKVTYTGTNANSTTGQIADAYTEIYSYTGPGEMTTKQWSAVRDFPFLFNGVQQHATANLTLSQSYTWDVEGRMKSSSYPNVNACGGSCQSGTNVTGPAYSYTYDQMGRLYSSTRTDIPPNGNETVATSAMYNEADQLTSLTANNSMNWESRTYNNLHQLTGLTQNVPAGLALSLTYYYPVGANNGKISSMVDSSPHAGSGETVSYTYDSLNRLSTASGSGASTWTRTNVFDGFGNLTGVNGSGTASSWSQQVNLANNQLTTYTNGYDPYGNQILSEVVGQTGVATLAYDVENRLTSMTMGATALGQYAYNHLNQRVWRQATENSTTSEYIYFYGLDGRREMTYKITAYPPNGGNNNLPAIVLTASDVLIYFGREVMQEGSYSGVGQFAANYVTSDRLGSMPGGAALHPWGDEGSATSNDKIKFATYLRDGESGIDYAMNRYYSSGTARFLSPDPKGGSATPAMPMSWNRYSYALGDPINHRDTLGLCTAMLAGITMGPTSSEEFDKTQISLGAVAGFPYNGLDRWDSVGNVIIQGSTSDGSTAVALQTLLDALNNNSGSINVIAYSGGAGAFTAAFNLLSSADQDRIGNILYISPGNAGMIATTQDHSHTKVIKGNDIADVVATSGTLLPNDINATPTDCAHTDLVCLLGAATSQIAAFKADGPCIFQDIFSFTYNPPVFNDDPLRKLEQDADPEETGTPLIDE